MPAFDEVALTLLQRAFPEYDITFDGRAWTARPKAEARSVLTAGTPEDLMRQVSRNLYGNG
jgi:hypothetical protein